MKQLKIALAILTVISCENLFAAGMTNWAVPTEIRTINDGILIFGAFGNPGGCGNSVGVVVKNNTNEFDFVKSSALAALMAQKQMRFYIYTCEVAYDNWNLNIVYPSRNISIRH